MKEPLFFVLRHGKTSGNVKGTYRSWSNDLDAQLSPEGREGVCESAIFLKNVGYTFSMILCDDLDRTQETAAITASVLGVKVIETVPGLKPLNVGDFTGKSKDEYPLDEYLKDTSKEIPGGESLDTFDSRQKKVFGDILDLVIATKKPVLVIGHGSTVSFLNNHMSKTNENIGYEGLVHPSGVLMFTSDGIIPLIKKRYPVRNPYKDGTRVAGFVTAEENKPPRECWNCRNYHHDAQTYLGSCDHIMVRIDPELTSHRQEDGTVSVGDRSCCDFFRNKIGT